MREENLLVIKVTNLTLEMCSGEKKKCVAKLRTLSRTGTYCCTFGHYSRSENEFEPRKPIKKPLGYQQ